MTYYKNWSCPNTASDWQIGRHDSCCALWDAKGTSPFLGTLTGFWQASPDTHILALTHTYCLPLVQGTLTSLKCATLGPWHAHVCNVHPRCVFSLCADNNKWCSCSRPSNLPRTNRNMSLAEPYVSQYGKHILKCRTPGQKKDLECLSASLWSSEFLKSLPSASGCWLSEASQGH